MIYNTQQDQGMDNHFFYRQIRHFEHLNTKIFIYKNDRNVFFNSER